MRPEDFLEHAVQYRDAASRLSDTSPFLFKPTFYCAIHAVELALKGHLIHSGQAPGDLRRKEFGHNIDRLLSKALEAGPPGEELVDYFSQQAVNWGSRDYSGKCFEYPERMYSTYPIGIWIDIADELIEKLQEKVR